MVVKNNNKKRWSDKFTPEQKKEYKSKKEDEKRELFDLYNQFLEKKTIKDIIQIIANYKQLHTYSFRNTILMYMQSEMRDDKKFAGIVNSYQNWKKQDIRVLKGSKGYKVLVPIFKKVEDKQNEDGDDKVLSYFKMGNVFDISQTTAYESYLEERKAIDDKIMNNEEIDYDIALNFGKEHFIEIEFIEDIHELTPEEEKGSYSPGYKTIKIHERSSHTIFHEIGHHISFKLDIAFKGYVLNTSNYAKNEILAEIGAFLLLQRFNGGSNYNFNYSNVWSSRIQDIFDFKTFESNFNKIKKFIDKLEITV